MRERGQQNGAIAMANSCHENTLSIDRNVNIIQYKIHKMKQTVIANFYFIFMWINNQILLWPRGAILDHETHHIQSLGRNYSKIELRMDLLYCTRGQVFCTQIRSRVSMQTTITPTGGGPTVIIRR